MEKRTFSIQLPGGATGSVLRSLKESSNSATAKIDWTKGDLLEFSSSNPEMALLRMKLIFPDARIIERKNGKDFPYENKIPKDWIDGLLSCSNKNCITAQQKEPVRPKFKIISSDPVTVQCFYCGRYMDHSAVLSELGRI